jgi:hypothetical protein
MAILGLINENYAVKLFVRFEKASRKASGVFIENL